MRVLIENQLERVEILNQRLHQTLQRLKANRVVGRFRTQPNAVGSRRLYPEICALGLKRDVPQLRLYRVKPRGVYTRPVRSVGYEDATLPVNLSRVVTSHREIVISRDLLKVILSHYFDVRNRGLRGADALTSGSQIPTNALRVIARNLFRNGPLITKRVILPACTARVLVDGGRY